MTQNLRRSFLLLGSILFLLSGCSNNTVPINADPDDIPIRTESYAPLNFESETPTNEGEKEPLGQNTIESFSEASEFKDRLQNIISTDFDTVDTGMGIIDRADVGTGYVELRRFENGLLGTVTFTIPLQGDEILEELAGYAAILAGRQLDEAHLLALDEAVQMALSAEFSYPVEVEIGEIIVFITNQTDMISMFR